jgi:hypothetical protein
MMDAVVDQLVCRFCGKPAKSRSGLTNHEKTCSKAPKDSKKIDEEVGVKRNPHEWNLGSETPTDTEPDQECNLRDRSKQPKTGQFQIGAFFILGDHIPMLLDIDFCSALSTHILEHGSPNSAVMAFAHQLNKITGD